MAPLLSPRKTWEGFAGGLALAVIVAVVLNVGATLLSPICSAAGFQYLILMRILMGLGGGLTFPAMNVLVAEWAPKQERSTMSSLIYGGTV